MILIERTQEARDGDIVVALVGGNETTLKRFYREAGRHHPPATGKFNAETDPGAGAGRADSRPPVGGDAKVTSNSGVTKQRNKISQGLPDWCQQVPASP